MTVPQPLWRQDTVSRPGSRSGVSYTPEQVAAGIARLAPWFHNMELLPGVWTNPNHFLGNYPGGKWTVISRYLPDCLQGQSVLDVGCNAGFHAIQMKKRGAGYVLGIDHDPRYLAQARFAADVLNVEIDLQELSVYEVESLPQSFDYVFFMGVFYHLRHPLLALDLISPLIGERLIFQSMIRGARPGPEVAADYPITERVVFEQPGFPAMYFIEQTYSGDWTNWWVPNEAGMLAMLRSCGLHVIEHPEEDLFICEPGPQHLQRR